MNRSSVLGQALVEALSELVASKDLSEAEALSLLQHYDSRFDAALAHDGTPCELRCRDIVAKNRCGKRLFWAVEGCTLVEAGVETDLGNTIISAE